MTGAAGADFLVAAAVQRATVTTGTPKHSDKEKPLILPSSVFSET